MSADFVTRLITVGLGCVVLLTGRKVFWLVVGLIGFLFGVNLGELLFAERSIAFITLGAIALGLLGAVVAIVFERVAFALAGFFAGAYLTGAVCNAIGILAPPVLVLVIAGLFGALIAALLMDWAIIVLSALCGAVAIVSGLGLAPPLSLAAIGALAVLGVFAQQVALRRRGGQAP